MSDVANYRCSIWRKDRVSRSEICPADGLPEILAGIRLEVIFSGEADSNEAVTIAGGFHR